MMVYAKHLSMPALYASHSTKHLCGVINITDPDQLQATRWKIQGISSYYIDLFFEKFMITYSKQCHVNSLALSKYKNHIEFYCGHHPDWQESCPCQVISAEVKVAKLDVITSFVMHYSMTRRRRLSFQMASGIMNNGHQDLLWKFDNMPDMYQIISLHIFAHTRIDLVSVTWRDTFSEEMEIYEGKSNPQDRFTNAKYAYVIITLLIV